MVFDGLWWSLVVFGSLWWCLVVFDGCWWSLGVFDGLGGLWGFYLLFLGVFGSIQWLGLVSGVIEAVCVFCYQ